MYVFSSGNKMPIPSLFFFFDVGISIQKTFKAKNKTKNAP